MVYVTAFCIFVGIFRNPIGLAFDWSCENVFPFVGTFLIGCVTGFFDLLGRSLWLVGFDVWEPFGSGIWNGQHGMEGTSRFAFEIWR